MFRILAAIFLTCIAMWSLNALADNGMWLQLTAACAASFGFGGLVITTDEW